MRQDIVSKDFTKGKTRGIVGLNIDTSMKFGVWFSSKAVKPPTKFHSNGEFLKKKKKTHNFNTLQDLMMKHLMQNWKDSL